MYPLDRINTIALYWRSMIWESVKGEEEIEEVKKLSSAVLMLQGIATSIDALSVGFTIADYGLLWRWSVPLSLQL